VAQNFYKCQKFSYLGDLQLTANLESSYESFSMEEFFSSSRLRGVCMCVFSLSFSLFLLFSFIVYI